MPLHKLSNRSYLITMNDAVRAWCSAALVAALLDGKNWDEAIGLGEKMTTATPSPLQEGVVDEPPADSPEFAEVRLKNLRLLLRNTANLMLELLGKE